MSNALVPNYTDECAGCNVKGNIVDTMTYKRPTEDFTVEILVCETCNTLLAKHRINMIMAIEGYRFVDTTKYHKYLSVVDSDDVMDE